MQELNFGKKNIESLLEKMEKISEKRINTQLINDCYKILKYYETPLATNYNNISNFCSELRVHSEKKHHFPCEKIRKEWKLLIIKYLNFIKNNYESFNEI
jgi:hypothetical protein